MRAKRSGVYQIVNEINGKSYVGSSRNITNRWKQWRSSCKSETGHVSILKRAFAKYGLEHFTFIILEECTPTKEALEVREQYYIDTLKPAYNVLQKAYLNSEEVLQRMKNALSGGRSGGAKALLNGTHNFIIGLSAKSHEKRAALLRSAGRYDPAIMEAMRALTETEVARAKKKATFRANGHQQGVKNNQYGTCWMTNGIENKRIKISDLEGYIALGFVKGRCPNRI